MKLNFIKHQRFVCLLLSVSTFAVNAAAQAQHAKDKVAADGTESMWWYTVFLIVIGALVIAFYLWHKSKKGEDQPDSYENRYRDYYANDSYDMEGVDAEKEMEWLRKAKKSASKPQKLTFGPKQKSNAKKQASPVTNAAVIEDRSLDTKVFQEKMRKLQYTQLPINSFGDLLPAKTYNPLPVLDDPALTSAIEQVNEEFEEDEAVRDLAVRILAAFKTGDSVDALSQIALYDISANLRSKAVSALTEFDHESVFETILLACADPTREVRAAAARGLFRLNFNRADAWKRIIETNDDFRMIHAARAAIEAGIAGKGFERLLHEDLKVSYEAFVLAALVIKSGETQDIFDAIKNNKDERVKFALLHVLKAVKDERSLSGLNEILAGGTFTPDVTAQIIDTIKSFEQVAV